MGELIPRYNILETLGESEKAVVYLAESDALGRVVALKVSRRSEEDDSGRQLFAREYAAICGLRHPSIVDIHDYGMFGGHEYLAMEYFPRGDLRGRMRTPLSEEACLEYIEQIARALRIVHDAGILHRDLKPANVMLRHPSGIVLIDFGLARRAVGDSRSTRIGVLRGSPFYMSPEHALGEELDERTDLYSLGVICYEMLTGARPYRGESAIEILEQHVHAPIPELPRRHLHLQPLIKGLMAKRRDHRFAHAGQVIDAVTGFRKAHAPVVPC